MGILDRLRSTFYPALPGMDPTQVDALRRQAMLMAGLQIHPLFGGGIESIGPALLQSQQGYRQGAFDYLDAQEQQRRSGLDEEYRRAQAEAARELAEERRRKPLEEAERQAASTKRREDLLALLPPEERAKWALAPTPMLESHIYGEKKEDQEKLTWRDLGNRVVGIDEEGNEVRSFDKGATPTTGGQDKPTFTPAQILDNIQQEANRILGAMGPFAGPQGEKRAVSQAMDRIRRLTPADEWQKFIAQYEESQPEAPQRRGPAPIPGALPTAEAEARGVVPGPPKATRETAVPEDKLRQVISALPTEILQAMTKKDQETLVGLLKTKTPEEVIAIVREEAGF